MVRDRRAWSMDEEMWEWLRGRRNQSGTIRKALTLYREMLETPN